MGNMENILYYGTIEIKNDEGKAEQLNIYCEKETIDGKQQTTFYANDKVIATVGENGAIKIAPEFADKINEIEFLDKLDKAKEQLKDKEPIPVSELEEKEQDMERQKGTGIKKQEQKEDKEEQQPEEEQEEKDEEETDKKEIGQNDIEIKMDTYITPDKTIADLIPEIKEKGCEKVKIRSNNNVDFELYGIDKDGDEVELESLKQTEGTNPTQTMTKISNDGTKMEQTRVSTMLRIQPGENAKTPEDEGLGIKIGELGIEEVLYYRRDAHDRYVGVPVGLETTNEKYNEREVQEFASQEYNPEVEDEMHLIEKAAARNNMSIEGFLEEYKKVAEKNPEGNIQDNIERTEDEINGQFRGNNGRTR